MEGPAQILHFSPSKKNKFSGEELGPVTKCPSLNSKRLALRNSAAPFNTGYILSK